MYSITVVITSYNLENHIDNCLKELLLNTFQDYEIIVIDDCSNDNTQLIIESYLLKFGERLRLVRLPQNLGSPSKVRNIALQQKLIKGEFVVFLDGDDSIEPTFLEKLFNRMKGDVDIAVCGYDRRNIDGDVLCQEMLGFPPEINLPQEASYLPIINGSLWNKLIRTSLLEGESFPDYKVGEDLTFLNNLYIKTNKITFIDEILIHYNIRGDSVISNTELSTIREFATGLLETYNKIENENLRKALELTIFIHIGVSMAIRAYDNREININEHLRWTREYFMNNFSLFVNKKSLSLQRLWKIKLKGIILWGCKIAYRLNCFIFVLWIYKTVTNILKFDLKF